MSVAYTPVFNTIFNGSLHGVWPGAAVMATLLPIADKHGVIDMSLKAISQTTGWPMDLLKQGIDQLMQADPDSRSREHDGRRLVLVDSQRTWGWRFVNYTHYSEKARLMSKSAKEVAEGRNQRRLADDRATTADDRRRPPTTADDRR